MAGLITRTGRTVVPVHVFQLAVAVMAPARCDGQLTSPLFITASIWGPIYPTSGHIPRRAGRELLGCLSRESGAIALLVERDELRPPPQEHPDALVAEAGHCSERGVWAMHPPAPRGSLLSSQTTKSKSAHLALAKIRLILTCVSYSCDGNRLNINQRKQPHPRRGWRSPILPEPFVCVEWTIRTWRALSGPSCKGLQATSKLLGSLISIAAYSPALSAIIGSTCWPTCG